MPTFSELSKEEIELELKKARDEYAIFQAKGLALNMARGKPSAEQIELSLGMLETLSPASDLTAEDGTDCCNYGVLDGIPEAKRLMASLLDDDPENIIVLGNSSLTAMYDTIARCVNFGTIDAGPWSACEKVKWLCPCPGYDRHFAITEAFGFEMINIPMNESGPDMDLVERIVAEDDSVKGIWCVPKYSNPGGVSYSDEVVRRLAEMECAAQDFRIFWDNAYSVHHLYGEGEQDQVLDIAEACAEAGTPDRYFKFGSTSKITIPGAGVAAMAASPENIAHTKKYLGVQAIGHDKLNQLRHVRFLKDEAGIADHMRKHADIIRPKFEAVLAKLEEGLSAYGIGTWSKPRGGYFISFNAPEGCARRIVGLAKEAGVQMTGAGATWPYGKDPLDSNIRIAPTLPPLEELELAMDVFVCCAKIAYAEKLLAEFEAASL